MSERGSTRGVSGSGLEQSQKELTRIQAQQIGGR
jgi:hypothetical protein